MGILLILSILYLLNFLATEIFSDEAPLYGNVDEVIAAVTICSCLRYFDIDAVRNSPESLGKYALCFAAV